MSMTVKHWQDPVNLVLGLWMLVSPWVLGHQAETNPTAKASSKERGTPSSRRSRDTA